MGASLRSARSLRAAAAVLRKSMPATFTMAEIAYADSALGHFIATLRKSGAYQNAIIIIVGDHGEGLGEHGEETHGLFLYDSTLHVPLIIKMPEAAHRGLVVDTLVSHYRHSSHCAFSDRHAGAY